MITGSVTDSREAVVPRAMQELLPIPLPLRAFPSLCITPRPPPDLIHNGAQAQNRPRKPFYPLCINLPSTWVDTQ